MGTRADFYVGRGENAEWLGSIAWDGYPEGIKSYVFEAETEDEFRKRVKSFLSAKDDATTPNQGWPWPWEDSRTTDYAYAFEGGKVHASCFGHAWFDPMNPPNDDFDGEKTAIFPNMEKVQNITMGERSGIILIRAKTP